MTIPIEKIIAGGGGEAKGTQCRVFSTSTRQCR
jgi:hypothetical protein